MSLGIVCLCFWIACSGLQSQALQPLQLLALEIAFMTANVLIEIVYLFSLLFYFLLRLHVALQYFITQSNISTSTIVHVYHIYLGLLWTEPLMMIP